MVHSLKKDIPSPSLNLEILCVSTRLGRLIGSPSTPSVVISLRSDPWAEVYCPVTKACVAAGRCRHFCKADIVNGTKLDSWRGTFPYSASDVVGFVGLLRVAHPICWRTFSSSVGTVSRRRGFLPRENVSGCSISPFRLPSTINIHLGLGRTSPLCELS